MTNVSRLMPTNVYSILVIMTYFFVHRDLSSDTNAWYTKKKITELDDGWEGLCHTVDFSVTIVLFMSTDRMCHDVSTNWPSWITLTKINGAKIIYDQG